MGNSENGNRSFSFLMCETHDSCARRPAIPQRKLKENWGKENLQRYLWMNPNSYCLKLSLDLPAWSQKHFLSHVPCIVSFCWTRRWKHPYLFSAIRSSSKYFRSQVYTGMTVILDDFLWNRRRRIFSANLTFSHGNWMSSRSPKECCKEQRGSEVTKNVYDSK